MFRHVADPVHLHLARPFDALYGKCGDRLTRIQASNVDRLTDLDLQSVDLDLIVSRANVVCITALEACVLLRVALQTAT